MTRMIFLLFLFGTQAQAFDETTFRSFLAQIHRPRGVQIELEKFRENQEPLPAEYTQLLIKNLHVRVFAEKERMLRKLDQDCHEGVRVTFPDNLGSDQAFLSLPSVQEFESGFVRIETVSCFDRGTPSQIMAIFSDPQFQLEAIRELRGIEKNGDLTCDRTEVFGLGRSHYCYNPQINSSTQLALNHHYNVWNENGSDVVPVYYRELFATAQRTPGGVAFHLVVYIRSVKFEGLKRFFARKTIESEQMKSMQLLREKLL